MTIFSIEDQRKIAQAIESAEQKTSGEIVAVVASESDNYRFIALLWAAILSLSVPFFLLLLPRFTDLVPELWSPTLLYLIQLAIFILLALLFQLAPLRYRLIPASIKHGRAHHMAVKQFLAQDLHTTCERTGILLFVSRAEHYVEVIADDGIYQKMPQSTWDDVVGLLTGNIRRGKPTEGFIEAITLCGEILGKHFPPGSEKMNELPNHLIILD